MSYIYTEEQKKEDLQQLKSIIEKNESYNSDGNGVYLDVEGLAKAIVDANFGFLTPYQETIEQLSMDCTVLDVSNSELASAVRTVEDENKELLEKLNAAELEGIKQFASTILEDAVANVSVDTIKETLKMYGIGIDMEDMKHECSCC